MLGRPWRAGFAPGIGCAVAAGMIAVMGCGGRTSMLELEGYELAGASSGGSSPTGGKATGTAGAQPIPSAGAPSTPTTTQCAQYCSGYAKACAKELKGQDCQQVCEAEMDAFGAKCQSLGLSALQCLTPFFEPRGGTCETATNISLALCATELTNFKSCQTGMPLPTPTPTPVPNPKPTPPTPNADPATCASMGSITPNSCDLVFGCAQGTYRASCGTSADGAFTRCYCFSDDGSFMSEMPVTDYTVACYVAVAQCPRRVGAI
jgi:hypothetical protein